MHKNCSWKIRCCFAMIGMKGVFMNFFYCIWSATSACLSVAVVSLCNASRLAPICQPLISPYSCRNIQGMPTTSRPTFMFLQRMTDSMNRLVDFLTIPQKGDSQSGLLDANKVCSCQSWLLLWYKLCSRSGQMRIPSTCMELLAQAARLTFTTCCQGELRREIAKTSCVPKTSTPGGQVRLHQQGFNAFVVQIQSDSSAFFAMQRMGAGQYKPVSNKLEGPDLFLAVIMKGHGLTRPGWCAYFGRSSCAYQFYIG